MPPFGVDSARNSTPVLQPVAQRKSAPKCRSWKDLSRTSQPPSGAFGVPTSSPFEAVQFAWPSTFQPSSVEPLKVQSGMNVLRVPARGALIAAARRHNSNDNPSVHCHPPGATAPPDVRFIVRTE